MHPDEESPTVTVNEGALFAAGLVVGALTLAGSVASVGAWLDVAFFRQVTGLGVSQLTLLIWLATGAVLAWRLCTFRHRNLRQLCETRMCKYWQSPDELGSVVSRSLIRLTKDHPATGWIRADTVSEAASAEILALRRRIEELETSLEEAAAPPDANSQLSQGDDQIELTVRAEMYAQSTFERVYNDWPFTITWNELFARIAPLMIDHAPDSTLRGALNELATQRTIQRLHDTAAEKNLRPQGVSLSDDSYRTVMVQLRALNLVTKRDKQRRGVYDSQTYWSLTPLGDRAMTILRAIRREPTEPAA